MEDLVVFAIERHMINHVGLPGMDFIGSTKLEDGSGFVKHYKCRGCGTIVDVTEPIKSNNGQRSEDGMYGDIDDNCE